MERFYCHNAPPPSGFGMFTEEDRKDHIDSHRVFLWTNKSEIKLEGSFNGIPNIIIPKQFDIK